VAGIVSQRKHYLDEKLNAEAERERGVYIHYVIMAKVAAVSSSDFFCLLVLVFGFCKVVVGKRPALQTCA